MANIEGKTDNRDSESKDNLGGATSAFIILLADTNNVKEQSSS